tara:strand:- start:306 stop:521 length:216 start_codon:yes stop_codon:yes gene_type:complete
VPHYIVEEIDFDFDEEVISKDERIEITQDSIGVWHVDEESELIDKITDTMGWCIKSIKYVPNQPHRLTAYL